MAPKTRPQKSGDDDSVRGRMTETAEKTTEELKVERNRMEYFLEMGFEDTMAALLAHSHVDWHRMKDLLDQGCARDLAVRILMGTDANGNHDPTWVEHNAA